MLLITSVALLAGCNSNESQSGNGSSESANLIVGSGNASSNGLSISNGNFIVQPDQPGIAFATVTQPQGPEQIAYFLLFNHDLRSQAGFKTQGGSDGTNAQTSHAFTTFGKECTVDYSIALATESQATGAEEISIDKKYDPSNGRVFLIDMKLDLAKVTQLDLPLPDSIPAMTDAEATRKFGQETLTSLRSADRTVDEFCQRASKPGT